MKKIIALLIIIAMVIPLTPAVLASGEDTTPPEGDCAFDDGNCAGPINTTVTMTESGTSSEPPIIKCKWEYDLDVEIDLDECPDCEVPSGCYAEDIWENDACVCIEGLQVKPILGGDVYVGYYAIVTDPQGVSTVDSVYADIWHPDGQFKYQIELFPLGFDTGSYDKTEALAAWDHVTSCHPDLVTYNEDPRYNDSEIRDELNQELAYVYYAEAPINYCQPGGWYKVGIIANDNYDSWCDHLFNYFWYIPTSGIEIDFETVDYGTVAEDYEQQAGGDQNMGTPALPTVRNIGNTPVELWVSQDDMGFGQTGYNPAVWNVEYAARLSADGEKVIYEPEEDLVRIPGILDLCTLEKLDFFITVHKGWEGVTYDGTMDLCAYINMSSYVFGTPEPFVGFYPGPPLP